MQNSGAQAVDFDWVGVCFAAKKQGQKKGANRSPPPSNLLFLYDNEDSVVIAFPHVPPLVLRHVIKCSGDGFLVGFHIRITEGNQHVSQAPCVPEVVLNELDNCISSGLAGEDVANGCLCCLRSAFVDVLFRFLTHGVFSLRFGFVSQADLTTII